MNQTVVRALVCAFAIMLLALKACKREPKQRPIEPPPAVTRLQFTGQDSGWPPRPVGRSSVRAVAWTQIPGDLTDSLTAQLRRVATADQRVRGALGTRFAFVTVSPVEVPKDSVRAPSAPRTFRLAFFSHSNNVPVEVLVRELRVQLVVRRRGYDLPEGREEVEAAITLARRDRRLRTAVTGLLGSAILAYPDSGASGFGHRLLHVTFARRGEDAPRYWAYVDLTDDRVLDAGKEP